jgi:hypothetical protein
MGAARQKKLRLVNWRVIFYLKENLFLFVEADWSQGMLAIFQCRIFCLPLKSGNACYLSVKNLLSSIEVRECLLSFSVESFVFHWSQGMLAIFQCRIFCLLLKPENAWYLSEQNLLSSIEVKKCLLSFSAESFVFHWSQGMLAIFQCKISLPVCCPKI